MNHWLRSSFRVTNNSRVSIYSSSQSSLHGFLDKRRRELDYSQLSSRIAQNRVLQIQRATLIHSRVGFLHAFDSQDLSFDPNTSNRIWNFRSIVVPCILNNRTDISSRFTIPLEIRSDIKNLIFDGNRKQRFDLDLKQHSSVVRVSVVLTMTLVQSGVFSLQIRNQHNSVEIHKNGFLLQRISNIIYDAVPTIVGDRIALSNALDGGIGADSWEAFIGKDLRKLGPNTRITLGALTTNDGQVRVFAGLRRDISKLGVRRHHGANVVTSIAVSDTREVQIAVARDETFARLLHFLSEYVKEPDVVDVLGVLVVVETVDDGLFETLRDHVRTLALLEAVQDDLTKLHDVRVHRAEEVGRFAKVRA